MRTRASALRRAPGEYETIAVDLEDPRPHEVRVRMVSAGLCHSDDHVATGDIPFAIYPIIGGHEGAGVVEATGEAVTTVRVGDPVVFAYLAVCGRCTWCATGRQNLCDRGSAMQTGARPEDPTSYRVRDGDAPVGQMGGLGTFAEHTVVSQDAVIPVPSSAPLDKIALLGCGVCTGFGSAVNAAAVQPGDVVIVMGVGGVGINAVQGARLAGASAVIAVDPVELKLHAARRVGATHTCTSMDEATDLARGLTDGQGAASVVITVGVVTGEHVVQGFSALRKAGTVVVTSVSKVDEVGIGVPLNELTFFQKRIQGALFGMSNPTHDIRRMLQLYESGQLELDGLITRTYGLDDVAQGYRDMHAGRNVRGVVLFD